MSEDIKYIKTPLIKPLVRRKFAAKWTKDINKLSTWRIVLFVYRRHEIVILQLLVAVIFTIAILTNI